MNELKQRNILHLTHGYTSFIKDFIEKSASNFNKVYVLVRCKPIAELIYSLGIKEARIHTMQYSIDLTNKPKNIEVIPVPLWYLPFDFYYRRLGKSHFLAVDKIIIRKKIKFDFIHAHFIWSAGYVGAELKKKYHKPFVLTGHGYDVYDLPFKNKFWKNQIEQTIQKADVVITVSQSNKKALQKLHTNQQQIQVIPNGFNHKLFFPKNITDCRRKLRLALNKKIILTIGGLDKGKGHQFLIEATKILIKKQKNLLCLIIGDGQLRRSLNLQINKSKLDKQIKLLGYVKHKDLNNWFNASNLFVLPSLSESFGVVQIEAMACGKPVVATKNGGSEELITSNHYGLLCKKQDPLSLAIAINKALEMKFEQKEILKFSNNYNLDTIYPKILNIYRSCINMQKKYW